MGISRCEVTPVALRHAQTNFSCQFGGSMKKLLALVALCFVTLPLFSQDPSTWLADLPQAKDYVQKRVSSFDRSGGNGNARRIAGGETLTLLDEVGPGMISHVWVTIASDDPNHLKALVLRMYWDGEATP